MQWQQELFDVTFYVLFIFVYFFVLTVSLFVYSTSIV